ncbi:hypothetical protein Tco_0973299 [Tanacetum coccineum]
MGCLPRSACLGSRLLDPYKDILVLGESLEDWKLPSLVGFVLKRRSEDWLPFHTQAIVRSTPEVCFVSCGRPIVLHLVLSRQEARFSNYGPHHFKDSFQARFDSSTCPLVCGDKRVERRWWPEEKTGVKDLFGCEVCTPEFPRWVLCGKLMRSQELIAVHTCLIPCSAQYFKQEGVVPEIVFNIFEKLVFLLGRHTLHNESTRGIIAVFIRVFQSGQDDRLRGFSAPFVSIKFESKFLEDGEPSEAI